MKKSYIFIIGTIIVISGLAIFLNQDNQSVPEERPEIIQEDIREEVVLAINDGEGDIKTFEIEFSEGITAFDLLRNKTEELNLTLDIQTFDIGIMINAIGDKENGQGGKYWLYYVNEEMPMVAANKQEIRPGDKVEFRFEESSF